MYYKLHALHEAGHRLILHIFLYNNAERQEETERLAEKTYYYQRQTGIRANLSLKPYIVNSRNDRQLLHNLCLDNYPILFEGLHTTFFLAHPRLAGRMKIVRTHNIEHTFYFYLAKNKPLAWQALFFMIESVKLKYYEKILRHADRILAISQADRDELAARYPDRDVRLLNCFFDCTLPETSESGKKPFDGKKYILVADDDREIREIVSLLLSSEGYAVLTAEDGIQAARLASGEIDLYLLDVNMPGQSGILAASQIRKQFETPIVFLTAYSSESDKVMGFSVGADDYIVKPFSNAELLMRVRAILRRSAVYSPPQAPKNQIPISDLILDLDSQCVLRGGETVSLTYTEFKILELLAKNKKKIFHGDIVDIYRDQERGVIEWYDDEAAFFVRHSENVLADFSCYWGRDLEVIGDVYSNPELIGGEEE